MKPAQAKAFTLIEIMISVSIIVIITGVMTPGFLTYVSSQNLKQSQEQVKTDLRNAQNKALSGSYSDDVNTEYWGIRFVDESATYTFFTSPVADPSCTGTGFTDRSTGQALLDGNVIKSASGTSCVYFSLTNGDISTGGVASNTIYVGKDSTCKRVIFNQAGLIYTEDTNTTCP